MTADDILRDGKFSISCIFSLKDQFNFVKYLLGERKKEKKEWERKQQKKKGWFFFSSTSEYVSTINLYFPFPLLT